jgi:ppGpp synthetase/RelA/SpoT-type nucleotidyltranferase
VRPPRKGDNLCDSSTVKKDEEEGENNLDMANWVERKFGKGKIDKAGAGLLPWWLGANAEPPKEFSDYVAAVFNWRACHALPLNVFQKTLRVRASKVDPGAIVAQRLKRFASVMKKLAREEDMKLSQMQDLGGCRAIVSSITAVYKIYEMYLVADNEKQTEVSIKCKDYIREPKPDGYRGIHIVGRYHPRIKTRQMWDGQRIEIQLRTKLQHAFATAVETVTTFTRYPLKFGAGPDDWKRFFSLMGSALALREDTTLVPGTPEQKEELKSELRQTARKLKVRPRLRGWSDALRTLPRQNIEPGFKWLLLVLNTRENTVQVTGYTDKTKASEQLEKLELSEDGDLDPVLVYVSSINDLRTAYPNYYADTKEFLKALRIALQREK